MRTAIRPKYQTGVIGVVVIAMVVIVALQIDRVPYLSTLSSYRVYFDDAGGLVSGDKVVVSGIEVGKVGSITLATTDDGPKAKVEFSMNDTVVVPSTSQALIKTDTLLGRRSLTIVPRAGGKWLRPGQAIPNRNTVAPYSLTDALSDATDSIADTDTDKLAKALDTTADAFSGTSPQVRDAVNGVARLSKSIADRDNALRSLFAKSKTVSGVLGERSTQIDGLLTEANALFGELQTRRAAIATLITGTRDVAAQISGFIDDNNAQLTPVLEKLNKVVAILQDNSTDIGKSLDKLGPYANSLGEAVSSGPYFSSFVGVPTIGDVTATFLHIMQRKYPQAYQSFLRVFTERPEQVSTRPDAEHDPGSFVPATPPTTYPSGGGR